jgi:hypothetical protein
LHHNVLAIALANKLARIAWAVLAKGRAFELTRTDAGANCKPSATAGLTAPARDAIDVLRAGTKERPLARTKELRDMRSER